MNKTAIKKVTKATQFIKNQRLNREFSWIAKEFDNFHTLADLDLDNVDRYIRLHLKHSF